MPFGFLRRKGENPPQTSGRSPRPSGSFGKKGCLVCGEALVDSPQGPCIGCGGASPLVEGCGIGHVWCKSCLAGPAAKVIVGSCSLTRETDPVTLASRLSLHPELKLTSPDHDLLVGAALAAAFSNMRAESEKQGSRVAELAAALARAGSKPSGSRGEGAAASAGAFARLAQEALGQAAGEELESLVKDRARKLIGQGEDASCPRRNALVAILVTTKALKDCLGVDLPARGLACERAGKNPACAGAGCPFHR